MDEKAQEMKETLTEKPMQDKEKPDVTAGVHVRGHVKIHDPESGEIYVETGA